jgi:hypothetical protein
MAADLFLLLLSLGSLWHGVFGTNILKEVRLAFS